MNEFDRVFLNVDEALEQCKVCLEKKGKCHRIWNRPEILKKISKEKNILLITERLDNHLNYSDYLNLLAHYYYCQFSKYSYLLSELPKDISMYRIWSFFYCPKS